MDIETAFDAYHAGLFRYLVRLTGDADLAADAAQEAFVRLAQRPPRRFDNLKGWLYTVATNFAYDTLKVNTRRGEILDADADATPLGRAPLPPDAGVELDERRRAVQGALTALRERERTVLLMRAEGFSYREIADAAGIPMNSIGVTAARALRKLAAMLHPIEAELR